MCDKLKMSRDQKIYELKYSCIKDPYQIGLISNLSEM